MVLERWNSMRSSPFHSVVVPAASTSDGELTHWRFFDTTKSQDTFSPLRRKGSPETRMRDTDSTPLTEGLRRRLGSAGTAAGDRRTQASTSSGEETVAAKNRDIWAEVLSTMQKLSCGSSTRTTSKERCR